MESVTLTIKLIDSEPDIDCMHAITEIVRHFENQSCFSDEHMKAVYAWFVERFKQDA
jgi:hypothetical protein